MLGKFYQVRNQEKGFTLIELMIVVAIIGILAAIAVPNFLAYRNKARVASTVGSAEGVRSALAAFAADSVGNRYPTTMGNYGEMTVIVNANGGTLPDAEASASFMFMAYNTADNDLDGLADDYSMRFSTNGVNTPITGGQVLITPGGIMRCTGVTTASCVQ